MAAHSSSSSPCFSLSDSSDDDLDAEILISQAIDLHALEQITALNTCHLPDSVLPSDLESRFLRLKSLPAAFPQPANSRRFLDVGDDDKGQSSSQARQHEPMKKPTTLVALGKDEEEKKSPSPANLRKKKDQSPDSISRNSSSRSVSSPASSHINSSPPQRTGCFWCSPKRSRKNQFHYEEDLALDFDLGYWAEDGNLLSDFSSLSVKDQQRRLKTAMKEVEKIKQEAKKVAKSVKHASKSTKLSNT